jgi:hypothetical protein
LARWAAEQQVAIFMLAEAPSADLARVDCSNIVINDNWARALLTKVLFVSRNGVAIEFDSDTHIQSGELRCQRKSACTGKQINA